MGPVRATPVLVSGLPILAKQTSTFPTSSSLLDWGDDGKVVRDAAEEAPAAMVGLLLKKDPLTLEGELWADGRCVRQKGSI